MQEKQAPHRQLTMEELAQRIQQLTDRYESDVLTLRHAIHADPELSFKEFHTMERVVEALKAIGIPARCGIVGTGIVADIQGAAPGRTLLLRADMDALPITENNDLPFCSQNQGVMHACGHDVHTANLVGVARILNELKEHWNGTVRLVFQPAEESGGGGREMIKKGILDDFPIDASLALHTMTTLKPGHLSLGRENVTSFSDRFVIKVTGKSTHSAKPQEGVDAIAIAGQIIVALNGMLLKEIDPMENATYSIGKIQGGTAPNIICDSVEMVGMMRNVGPVTREKLRVRMEAMVTDIARAYGGKAEYDLGGGRAQKDLLKAVLGGNVRRHVLQGTGVLAGGRNGEGLASGGQRRGDGQGLALPPGEPGESHAGRQAGGVQSVTFLFQRENRKA